MERVPFDKLYPTTIYAIAEKRQVNPNGENEIERKRLRERVREKVASYCEQWPHNLPRVIRT